LERFKEGPRLGGGKRVRSKEKKQFKQDDMKALNCGKERTNGVVKSCLESKGSVKVHRVV